MTDKNTISLSLSDEPEDQFSPMLSVYKRRRATDIMKNGDEQNRREERRRGSFCLSLDLIVEILKRLPTKSLVRFRSVSKQWSTIIGSRKDFIDSIVTRSLRHLPQRLPVFIFHHCVTEPFFTVSPVFSQSTKHAVKIPGSSCPSSFQYQYARGLICCSSGQSHLVTIYNPTTKQLIPLPEIEAPVRLSVQSVCHFGYDPVMNQYKVLSMIIDFHDRKQTYHVFTLGQRQSWRKIKGFDQRLIPSVDSVCINGTIYYCASYKDINGYKTVLLSFDIMSERFDHVCAPESLSGSLSTARTLVNYLGKLGCICCNSSDTSIWIMDNAQKQEWSRTILCLPENPLSSLGTDYVYGFSGATPAGEIFATQRMYYFDKSLHVYYYDINQNSFRRVQVEGGVPDKTKNHCYWVRVIAIHDHVENTMWL